MAVSLMENVYATNQSARYMIKLLCALINVPLDAHSLWEMICLRNFRGLKILIKEFLTSES